MSKRILPEQKVRARDLFIREGRSQTAIAELLHISIRTVRRWAKEERWERDRIDALSSSVEIVARLKRAIANITSEIDEKERSGLSYNEKLVDRITKLTGAITRLDGQYDERGETVRAMSRLIDYCRVHKEQDVIICLNRIHVDFYRWLDKK